MFLPFGDEDQLQLFVDHDVEQQPAFLEFTKVVQWAWGHDDDDEKFWGAKKLSAFSNCEGGEC